MASTGQLTHLKATLRWRLHAKTRLLRRLSTKTVATVFGKDCHQALQKTAPKICTLRRRLKVKTSLASRTLQRRLKAKTGPAARRMWQRLGSKVVEVTQSGLQHQLAGKAVPTVRAQLQQEPMTNT